MKRVGVFAFIVSAAVAAVVSVRSQPIAGDEASFTLAVDGVESAYRLFPANVLPGGELPFSVTGQPDIAAFSVTAVSGSVVETAPGAWRWRAPETPGVYAIAVRRSAELEAIQIQAMVLTPADHVDDAGIQNFSMGRYPPRGRRGEALPAPPAGFARVTHENQRVYLSPNFVLGQFISGQTPGDQFVFIDPRLVLVLEDILKVARRRGPPCDTLRLLAGFRSPAYAKRLGEGSGSLHQWGQAAEFMVDCAPRDGRFDDLNGDGRLDHADVETLYDWIDATARVRPGWPLGALGLVRSDRRFGPHLYVDVGPDAARWKR